MTLVPPTLQAYAERGPDWASWIGRLPRLVRELLEEWSLTPDGEATHGATALVLPVRTGAGRPAVLKIGWPHPEAEHEALALQHWHGRGAVQLLRADPRRWALLLERLHREDLGELWDVRACEVVAGLYGQLHVPAPPQLRRLSEQCARWAVELGAGELPVPRRMVEQARSLARDLAGDEATDGVLIHTDLHFHNVLAADREEWLAIDPKPLSGDPHYELAPMLWNRFEEYAGRVRAGVRDRFLALVDAAGLDEDRARDWVIVRMLVNVRDELADHAVPDRDWITAMLSIAKAVQG
jgi:streptomycin 6-kinase